MQYIILNGEAKTVPEFTFLNQDSLFVSRIRAAGAIFIGKTNVPEFGYGSQTYNKVFGATRNAYKPSLTAGGSSGGAAVGLATRMLPVADGSDMMGSLRNPAAFNNVIGFRPSRWRVPNYFSGYDNFYQQLSTDGPMGRNVEDMLRLLSIMSGPDERLPLTLMERLPEYEELKPASLNNIKIGWMGDYDGYLPTENGLLKLCEKALEDIGHTGLVTESCSPRYDMNRLWRTWLTLRHWDCLWAKDYHKLFNPDVPFIGSQEWEYNKNCQWIDDPKFIESLNSQTFKDLEYLHLLGGEPLMVVKHYEILQKIIDGGYAKNIQIEYNTNGTHFFSKEQLNILSQFKKLAVNMSIDDIGSRFEYQRKNGVWADVWENIKKFYALQNNFVSVTGILPRIGMTPAVSIFNVYYVRDYLNFFRNEGIDVSRLSLNHWVHDWGLDVRELMPEQRQRVLDNIRPTCPEEDIEWLRCIIERLESDDYKPIRMQSRDWKINGFDGLRGETFAQTHPEMYDIIKQQWTGTYEN